MHICKKCGTKFDSKFCPECGTPAPAEVCPYCGAAVSPENKFCPECGKALGEKSGAREPNASPLIPSPKGASVSSPSPSARAATNAPAVKTKKEKTQGASPAFVTFCSLLPYATAVLFSLFSAIFFLILLGSVSSVLGFGTGSVYDYLSMGSESFGGGFSDFFGGGMSETGGMGTVVNVCTALVVLGALGGALAVCAVAFRFCIPLRVKKIGNMHIYVLWERLALLCYFIDFLLGCILCGVVSDEITAPGAAPICVLVFAIFFGLCSAGAKVVQKFLPKFFPATAAELEKREKERRAVLTSPVKPEWKVLVKPTKPRKPKIKQYPEAACSEEMKDKILKHVKARNLLMAFAGVIFPLIFLIAFLVPLYIEGNNGHIPFPPALWISFLCYGILTAVLGGIFESKYRKMKAPKFNWKSKHTWNNAPMFWTVSVFGIVLLGCGILFFFVFISGLLIRYVPLSLYATYNIAFYSAAGALVNKGRKLSLAVYGASHPRKSKAMKEQRHAYILQKEAYIEQNNAYYAAQKEQREAWRKYRRELAYYEEGIVQSQKR